MQTPRNSAEALIHPKRIGSLLEGRWKKSEDADGNGVPIIDGASQTLPSLSRCNSYSNWLLAVVASEGTHPLHYDLSLLHFRPRNSLTRELTSRSIKLHQALSQPISPSWCHGSILLDELPTGYNRHSPCRSRCSSSCNTRLGRMTRWHI